MERVQTTVWLSECCGAPPFGETEVWRTCLGSEDIMMGMCEKCKEWSEFYTEEEQKDDRNGNVDSSDSNDRNS